MVDVEKFGRKRSGVVMYVEKTIQDCEELLEDCVNNKDVLVGTVTVMKKKMELIVDLMDKIIDTITDGAYVNKEIDTCENLNEKLKR